MKLIKTRRRGENTLEHAMRLCIEGPDQLPDETLEAVAKKSENWHFETNYITKIIVCTL